VNVLFVTSWYPTRDYAYGGIFVREHAKAVREAGHRVVVLHLAGPRPKLAGGLWTMEEELDPALSEGVEAHHVFHRRSRVPGVSYALYLQSALGAYRRVLADGFRPDVIHAHVYGAAVPAALVAGRSRTPLVITEHFSGVAQRSLSRVESRKARYAYNRAARILPVSRFLQDAIRSYGVDRPFEVVPNVVDTTVFFPPDGKSDPEARRRLLFVGNLEPRHFKGFPTLLPALALLRERTRDWQLDVIGDGPERVPHERAAAGLGLGEYVTFHGSRPKPEVAQAMREADLLVLPSRFDNSPCVIVEGLASGLPVVSTTVGGIPELVDEHSGRLVPPGDEVALAHALEDVLANLESFDRGRISAEARGRYSSEVVGKQLNRIYESVLAEAREVPDPPRAEAPRPDVERPA
jgi:glycosyltransferase involved in cell wall biosynthesis